MIYDIYNGTSGLCGYLLVIGFVHHQWLYHPTGGGGYTTELFYCGAASSAMLPEWVVQNIFGDGSLTI
jgi:hypothetical protein